MGTAGHHELNILGFRTKTNLKFLELVKEVFFLLYIKLTIPSESDIKSALIIGKSDSQVPKDVKTTLLPCFPKIVTN